MGKKTARRTGEEPYECKYDWPDDCFVQCGGDGIVFTEGSLQDEFENPVEALNIVLGKETKKKHYMTAFFEAFPENPSTFIRGEGATIEAAEKEAWKKLQKYSKCPGHEFEKRGYTNGAGCCKSCGMFKSSAFEPDTTFSCGCVFSRTDRYGDVVDVTWIACKDHSGEYSIVGFSLLLDKIKDLRAGWKSSQDHGEELSAVIKDRDATIKEMQAAFETMQDHGGG